MDPQLSTLLTRGGGLLTWDDAVQVVPPWTLDRACRQGTLRRILPGVYQDAAAALNPVLRRRAAVAWLAGRGALSHTSGLAEWGLHKPGVDDSVHVTVPRTVRLRTRREVEVHHRTGFRPEPPHMRVRGGQPIATLERCLVDSWPLLSTVARRGPFIQAVNDRLTTPTRLRSALAATTRLVGRGELARLLDLLAAGCRSPLEIYGHEHVFTGPGLPIFHRQAPVRIGARRFYLDVYAEAERVDFELDGSSVHADPHQREIDLRRDALLATVGILVVRFSHYRLVNETEAVRREVHAVLASRRHIAIPAS